MWYKCDIWSQRFKLWIEFQTMHKTTTFVVSLTNVSKTNSLFRWMFAHLNMLHTFSFSSSHFSGLLNIIWNKSSLWLLLYDAGIGWNPLFFSGFTRLKANLTPAVHRNCYTTYSTQAQCSWFGSFQQFHKLVFRRCLLSQICSFICTSMYHLKEKMTEGWAE